MEELASNTGVDLKQQPTKSMDLQLTDASTGYNSCDVSPRRGTGWNSFTKPQYMKAGLFIIMVLIFAIAIFIGGYYSGVKAASQESSNIAGDEPTIEWEGVCPKKSTSCPESYTGIPTLLLISLDGFRSDYLKRGYTPTLNNIRQCGTRTAHMYPVFPTKTFPNHFSIVTGLYPEYHGIIDNNMYDPVKRKLFKVGNSEFLKSFWWEAEPLWVTAQKQGKRSACYFWPGSEAIINGSRPTEYKKYNSKVPFDKRVDTVLEWLDRPQETRPDFITLYVNQPDHAGHYFSINSEQVNQQLVVVDKMIARLFYGLQQRDLLNCVNVIILSDHGMTDVSCQRLIKLQKYVNVSEVYSFLGVFGRLSPKGGNNETVIEKLIADLRCKNEHMRVYPKQELPVRYHYSHSNRIEPIFIDLDNKWSITNQNKPKHCNGGAHGYDNFFDSMKTIFMAHGPSFKFNSTVQPFMNIELYDLMAELLNISANPNNGTKGIFHSVLKEPEKLPPQKNPDALIVATVPIDKDVYELRISAANCSCQNGSQEQRDAENITSLRNLHLPFGIPSTLEFNQTQLILYNNDYIVAYNPAYHLPMWSAFTINEKKNVKETSPCWTGDARLPANETPSCTDYHTISKQGIQQRPLFPLSFAADDRISEALLISNSVPKHEDHFNLIERNFEQLMATLVQLKGPLNIMAGPAFDIQGAGVFPGVEHIMASNMTYGSLTVPTHYFYVITWCSTDINIQDCDVSALEVAAFLLPNTPLAYNCEPSYDLIKKHVARVADVEALTGISFFTKLPMYEAIALRTSVPIV